MPYRQTPNGTMEFNGKIAEWVQNFQIWYNTDFGQNAKISLTDYIKYITLFYSSLAKGKWQDEKNLSKIKTLEDFITTDQQGNFVFDAYLVLDFLAENLSSDEKNNWSANCRNGMIKMFNK